MKKIVAFALALILLATFGCGNNPSEEQEEKTFEASNVAGAENCDNIVSENVENIAPYTISITIENDDFYDICDNIKQDIEHICHLTIFAKDGEKVVSQDCGMKLFGGSSRDLSQKSFKFIARKTYSEKGYFDAPLFDNCETVENKYDSLILRNGGNDSTLHKTVDPYDATFLRDGLVNNIAKKLSTNVTYCENTLAEVYINGEYYGMMTFEENLNEDYIRRVYGADKDTVAIIKSELDTSRHCKAHSDGANCRFCNVWFYYETDEDEVSQQALSDWKALCEKAISAISADSATQKAVYEELDDNINLQGFIEYAALELYFENNDWPHNNVKIWRAADVLEGKFQFALRDNDMTMARYSSPNVLPELDTRANVDNFYRMLGNYLDYGKEASKGQLYPDSLYLGGLLTFCLQNDEFKAAFEKYANSLTTDASKKIMQEAYDEVYEIAEQLVEKQLERWPSMASFDNWKDACGLIENFINERPNYYTKQLNRALKYANQ